MPQPEPKFRAVGRDLETTVGCHGVNESLIGDVGRQGDVQHLGIDLGRSSNCGVPVLIEPVGVIGGGRFRVDQSVARMAEKNPSV